MRDATNDRWLRGLLTAIVLLLAVIAVELSVLIGPLEPRASAQVFDSALQRTQLLEAQHRTNATLDRILQHLKTQTIKVQVVSTDKDSRKGSVSKGPSASPGGGGAGVDR